MSADASPSDDLLRRASAGDPPALAELLGRYRDRLRQMVRLRLDRRLQGRLDPTEVVQAVATELPRRLPDYLAAPATPFYVWLRMLAGQKLVELQRRHLDTPAA